MLTSECEIWNPQWRLSFLWCQDMEWGSKQESEDAWESSKKLITSIIIIIQIFIAGFSIHW